MCAQWRFKPRRLKAYQLCAVSFAQSGSDITCMCSKYCYISGQIFGQHPKDPLPSAGHLVPRFQTVLEEIGRRNPPKDFTVYGFHATWPENFSPTWPENFFHVCVALLLFVGWGLHADLCKTLKICLLIWLCSKWFYVHLQPINCDDARQVILLTHR